MAYLDDALRRRVAALLTSLEVTDGFLALAVPDRLAGLRATPGALRRGRPSP